MRIQKDGYSQNEQHRNVREYKEINANFFYFGPIFNKKKISPRKYIRSRQSNCVCSQNGSLHNHFVLALPLIVLTYYLLKTLPYNYFTSTKILLAFAVFLFLFFLPLFISLSLFGVFQQKFLVLYKGHCETENSLLSSHR